MVGPQVMGMGHIFALLLVPASDSHLAANNGLYAGFPRSLSKLQGAEEIAAVGYSHRWHCIVAHKRYQFPDWDGTFKERIGGMNAKMNEVSVRQGEPAL